MPVVFRLGDQSISIHVESSWSILFLKQFVCMELKCDPHAHLLSHNGTQLTDWEKVSDFGFLGDGASVDVLPHTNLNHFYVLCYCCDNVTPAVFTTSCDKCDSPGFTLSSHVGNPKIKAVSGICEQCQNASGKVVIKCSNDIEHSPVIFLEQVCRNLGNLVCLACLCGDSEIIVKFCDNSGHVLCLECFRVYTESNLSDSGFKLIPDIGLTISCPVGCSNSHVTDTHLFRILGKAFYSLYKDVAARLSCYSEGIFSCPNCGTFWERPDSQSRTNWFVCEKPFGCGEQFCSSCHNVIDSDNVMSAGSVKAPLIIPLRLLSHSHHSNAIDSATQIEISTDTPRAQIYFTVDGSRPDPKSWKSRKPQPGPTYLYRNSFALQSGLKTVKAMALLPDTGQESNIVTKTFDVAEASKVDTNGEADSQPKPDDYLFIKELKREMKKMQVSVKDSLLLRRKPSANGKKRTISLGNENEYQKPPSGENSLLNKSKIEPRKLPKLDMKTRSDGKKNEIARRLRTLDIFNCPTCLAPKPDDPESTFCTSCGGSLQLFSNSTDTDLDFCPICGSKVPVGSTKCLVCESTITAPPESANRRICQACGSLNPERVKYCLTCETNLPQTPTTLVNISPFLRSSAPSLIKNSKDSSVVNCRICSRQNGLSARFCEWCGIQDPGEEELTENRNCICPSCFWQSPKDSKFCPQCGFKLETIDEVNGFGDQLTVTPAQVFRKTVSTQTMELSPYSPPSSGKPKESSRTRLPIIAPVSPGKGLWRMQVEHLVAHVKSYANTDPEFQKAIGEPRLGKLLSAEVMGNRPDEVSILLTFHQHDPSIHLPTCKGNDSTGGELEVFVEVPRSAKSNYSFRPLSSDHINTPLRNPSSASTPAQQNGRTFRRKIVALRSPPSASKRTNKSFQDHPNKPSKVDNALMRELRPGHKADMYTVELLLMNGANPSCVDHYGDPLVVRAVRNQHLEAIHFLVKSGADMNAISSRKPINITPFESQNSGHDLLNRPFNFEFDRTRYPGFISGNTALPPLPKLQKRGQLFGSVFVPATLLEPTMPTESYLKPGFLVRIGNANQCAVTTSLTMSSMVPRPTCSTRDGNTPLHEAVLLGSRAEEFVKLLLKLGANPKKTNSLGLTPRELAIEANSLAAAEILANRKI
nr:ankyrin repeat containing protein C20orf12 [Hymenolepis microstoma]